MGTANLRRQTIGLSFETNQKIESVFFNKFNPYAIKRDTDTDLILAGDFEAEVSESSSNFE